MKADFRDEHTCFCAIKPEKRKNYVETITKNLKPTGFFAGLLFDFPLTEEGPPFGGSKKDYETLFTKNFNLEIFEENKFKHEKRQRNELF